MPDDDDLKISMDDIKDMVSELYGEKVDKVGTEAAKKILKEELLEFFDTGIENITSGQLTPEEEKLLADYEKGPVAPLDTAVKPRENPAAAPRPQVDKYGLPGFEAEPVVLQQAKAGPVTEAERAKKREETLKRIEEFKKSNAGYQAGLVKRSAGADGDLTTTYAEKVALINMFEQTQKAMAMLLSKLIKRRPVETMFVRTLQKAIKKHPDILKKTDTNQYGKPREDGTMETARLCANLNSMPLPEDKLTRRMFQALHDLFEERLIAIELASSLETKDDIASAVLMQIDRIFDKKQYAGRLKDMFIEHAVPSTTIKQGD